METSGATPAGAVTSQELADLVTEREGPFATLYLNTEGAVENAAQRSEVAWKGARDELAEQGAPEEVLAAIDPLVPEAHQHGDSLAVVADASGLLHVEHGRAVPGKEVARWAALPSLLPLVEWRQNAVPHVVVLADRTGADVYGFHVEGPDVHREVAGDDTDIRKVHPGGWSQRRYQNRAENTWQHNAKDVAEEVAGLADRIGARLVVAAGDVRALQLLEASLPKELLEVYRKVEGGRAPDGSAEFLPAEVAEVVEETVAAEAGALLEAFEEGRGQAGRSVEGAEDVVRALEEARVAVLFVRDNPDDPRTAYFGPGATQLALDRGRLHDLGVDEPKEGPLSDVLVRAALGTGAGVRVYTANTPFDGDVAAILRWS